VSIGEGKTESPERHVLSGVICAALTPLDAALAPDPIAAVEHCRRLLAAGCDGINLLGTTGEATSFTVDQRLALMTAIAQSDLPIERFMVGTGAAAPADAARLTAEAIALGFAGQLVVPPFYYKPISDEGLFRYYAGLIERVGDARMRLYFYHFPQLSGVPIPPSVIARMLAAYPHVVTGLKDSSGAPGYAAGLVAEFKNLAVFPSSESALDRARSDGFAGCISATVNISAPLAARVWNGSAQPGDLTGLRFLRETIAGFTLIPALRYLTSTMLGEPAWLRTPPPLTPLPATECSALDTALATNDAFARCAAELAA
jgi:4-hydroxy-tetrahydrodipicolinate synthase